MTDAPHHELDRMLVAVNRELVLALADCVTEIQAWRARHPTTHPGKPSVTTMVLRNAKTALDHAGWKEST